MRKVSSASAIELRLARLVHESAHGDAAERARHERFIATRLTAGALALAGLAPYLLWRGAPSHLEAVAIVCLVMPIVAAAILSRTGRPALAHAISSAALAGLVVCIAASSGGMASAATVWLAAIPLEAFLSGSRRAAITASLIAVFSVFAIAALNGFGVPAPGASWPVGVAMPVFAVMAIAHAAAQALAHARLDADRQAQIDARGAQDRSLLHAIDDLVTWHDCNGHVLKANAAAMKLVGAPSCSLQGRGLFARVHVSDRPAFLKAISDAAASPEPIVVQFRLRAGEEGDGAVRRSRGQGRGPHAPEARVIWVEMRAHRVEGGAGRDRTGCAVVAVTRDISEHRRRAEELEEARAAAECADRSKGRFLATVSHELRTPLNAIIGFSEILASDTLVRADDARRKEYAQIIHDSGQHLLGVVNTLLDLSKIESGKFEFVAEPLDLGELASASCDLMQLKAAQAGLTLARDIAREMPELVADRRACRQIFINLLSNAVKFTPRGGCVTVSVRRESHRVLLIVADTGIGIAEEDLPKVGDPFFQAGSHYDRAHEGTGLGLSVVRGLVGLHRGTLTIESAPGEGTAVTVSLPLDCRAGAAQTGGPIPVRALKRSRPISGFDQRMKHRA